MTADGESSGTPSRGGEAGKPASGQRRRGVRPASTPEQQRARELQEIAKQAAATQEVLRSLGGPGSLSEIAKQAATTKEVLRSLGPPTGLEVLLAGLARPRVPSISEEVREQKRQEPAPSRESSLPELRQYAKRHAPSGWESTREARSFASAIKNRGHVYVVVLAADIRSSTVLMKEAADSYEFASIVGDFVEKARQTVWERDGLFDKFTGDGFLAYWSPTAATKATVLSSIFRVVQHLHQDFRDRYIPLLRANSQNFPESRVGLGIGLDDGNAYPVAIADDPTIVGPAVVGAVRMVVQAGPGETLANAHLGAHLETVTQDGSLPGIAVVPLQVSSKEYDTQAAYAVKFLDDEGQEAKS